MVTAREIAVISVTRQGTKLAAKIKSKLGENVECYALPEWAKNEGLLSFKGSLRQTVTYCFKHYQKLVLIMATGAAVRMLAPCIKDKMTDPGIVVMDEQGDFAVSLLSGHLGGANQLAQTLAELTGARAVITTASDRQQLPALDVIFAEWGLKYDSKDKLTAAIASLVNGSGITLYARGKWLQLAISKFADIPGIRIRDLINYPVKTDSGFSIVISDEMHVDVDVRTLFLRPLTLWLGLGCRRGVTLDSVAKALKSTLESAGLSFNAVKGIASVDIKRDETALLKIAEKYDWSLKFFSRNELRKIIIEQKLTTSKFVEQKIGVEGVCEPAAIAASGGKLIVNKMKCNGVTVAVAREL